MKLRINGNKKSSGTFEFTVFEQERIKACRWIHSTVTVQSKLNELKEVDRSLETLKHVDGSETLRFKDLAQARKSD